MSHDVILRRRVTPGSRGYVYEVHMGGSYLLASRDPEYATCRALLERGLTGRVLFWRDGKASHDSSMDIERGSRFCASDTASGVRVRKFNPFQPIEYALAA